MLLEKDLRVKEILMVWRLLFIMEKRFSMQELKKKLKFKILTIQDAATKKTVRVNNSEIKIIFLSDLPLQVGIVYERK